MTRHSPAPQPAPLADAGERLARLCDVLALVEAMAGREPGGGLPLDEAAKLSGAYASALPIARSRFDKIAAQTAAWVAAGLEALTASGAPPPPAAAACLADELNRTLSRMVDLISERRRTA